MSRAVLAVMAGLLCALAGMKYAAGLKAEALRLSRWEQLLRHLTLLLQEGTLSLPEALCTAADGAHPPDKLLREIAALVRRAPLTTLEAAYLQLCADSPEKPLLQRMFSRLGRGSKDSRALAAEQSAKEMALLARQSAERAEKDVKLWQTLGFTGGVCLTILLL